jgi:hypothetical protein
MGRPIKKRFFVRGAATPSDVVKYKGIASSLTVTAGSGYSQGTTVSVSTPEWIDGVTATIVTTVSTTTGAISATVGNPGAGYLNAPTATVVKPATVTLSAALSTTTAAITGIATTGIYVGMRLDASAGMPANNYVKSVTANTVTGTYNFTANTTTNVAFSDQGSGAAVNGISLTAAENDTGTIKTSAYLPAGSSAVFSAIIKQEGSHRYLVENGQGVGICKLASTSTLVAGTMSIIATDVGGATYYVKKLTSRKAYLVPTLNFNGPVTVSRWTKGAASTGVVSIATY